MKRSKYSEEQIVKILKEADAGIKIPASAASTDSVTPPITTGKQNTVAWRQRSKAAQAIGR